MQLFANPQTLRNEILNLAVSCGLNSPCYTKMLDYTIKLFESQGLGKEYYGYHNITHELEVTYVTLIVLKWKSILNNIKEEDFKYLYAAALFHDFDPQKSVDKPHEDNVIRFLIHDQSVNELFADADLDVNIIMALILRTTYPWIGELKEHAERQIAKCFDKSPITKNNLEMQDYYMRLGWLLSIIDRVGGYSLGDFTKAMDMAKKNAHALAWHPSYIVKRSVGYFENLLNNEAEMCDTVLRALPKDMRKNFMDAVTGFLNLRQQEIKIQSDYLYENLRLIPKIESMRSRQEEEFQSALFEIFNELPTPLQINRENFVKTVQDPKTILNTLRVGSSDGPIIGFAKGGPLENYSLRPEIVDANFGKHNTVFLEPIALKMGYWGMRGGS
ncbi:MAG: HD domain-containing protein, partial [Candidatus Nitrosotenuis sp.]